jgi:hypothetical protein
MNNTLFSSLLFCSVRETHLRHLRQSNQQSFDEVWGREDYLLEHGVSFLPSFIEHDAIEPRIFTDWASTQTYSSRTDKAAIPAPAIGQGRSRGSNSDALVHVFRRAVRGGDLEEAHKLGLSLLKSEGDDVLHLLEFGVTQFLRGEYASAFEYCSRALQSSSSSSSPSPQISGCIGMAGMYLPNRQEEAIAALLEAWRSADAEVSAAHSDLFAVTRSSIEHSLVQALHIFERHAECVARSFEMMKLPRLEEGGGYILMFAAVDWSSSQRYSLIN